MEHSGMDSRGGIRGFTSLRAVTEFLCAGKELNIVTRLPAIGIRLRPASVSRKDVSALTYQAKELELRLPLFQSSRQ